MEIQYGTEEIKPIALGRTGVEYTLIPESDEDQQFLDSLDTMLRRPEFTSQKKSPMMRLSARKTEQDGNKMWEQYIVGIITERYIPLCKKLAFWR